MNQNIELKDLVHQLNLLVAEINHRVEPSNPRIGINTKIITVKI
jgi:hypothetical protein